MKIHDLIQGSAEWLAYRAQHFNASDAPAMMGCSPYKTRSQLLHELNTGLAAEVDGATQRRFDDGHRFEALARPLAEEIVGDDLYPVTGSEGRLSASFDGLTLDGAIAYEHKTLNDELRAVMVNGSTAAPLPLLYRVQLEQQVTVSGCKRVLFMASQWAADGRLLEERHCWYEPDAKLRAEILAGWEQFAKDLQAHVPRAAAEPAPAGKAPETLPALRIEVTGMVTASNLAEFKQTALAAIRSVNRELSTDTDFANAESAVKWCGEVETRLAAAKEHALSQTASIDALFKTIDDISAEARQVRLELDKLVKARKESIRAEIVAEGVAAFSKFIRELNTDYMPRIATDFPGVIKGKRTVASLRDAVDTELARAKIEASAVQRRIAENLRRLTVDNAEHAFLFSDVSALVLKESEDLTAIIRNRIADHQAKEAKRLEAERDRIRAEEQAKAQQEAAAQAQREREREATAAAAPAPAAAVQTQAPAVVPMHRPAVARNEPPTLNLGAICSRLGFTMTAAFVTDTLGVAPARTDKRASLYTEHQFEAICSQLVWHVEQVCAGSTAAA